MNDFFQHIDDYLDGDLTPEMEKSFQDKLVEVPTLKEDVDFHAQVRRGIDALGCNSFKRTLVSIDQELDQEGFFSSGDEKSILENIETIGQDEFKNLLINVDQELAQESFYDEKSEQPKVKVFAIRRRLLAIAASIAILIASVLVIWSIPQNSTELYQNNFVALSDLISTDLSDERSEMGFVGSDGSLDSLASAMKLYNETAYREFISLTNNLVEEDAIKHYRDRILLHRGIAFLVQKNYGEAQEAFSISGDSKADWYAILTYLAQGQSEDAIQFFETLENPSQQIRDLIRKL